MIRVLVVDDHPIVREGLTAVLEDQADIEVVGTAASAEEAFSVLKRAAPSVILLDLEMQGVDGAAAIPRLRAILPEARLLLFTAYDTDERVVEAIRAGASGCLRKGAPADRIAEAIRVVHGGGAWLEPDVATRVVERMRRPDAPKNPLSAREREVLGRVAEGLSNKQIAHALAITERTVKFHLASLFAKLGADNRAQAVALALEKGLLSHKGP